MTTHPHLIFPPPGRIKVPPGRRRSPEKIKTPTPQEQGERILPKFSDLVHVLEKKCLALQDTLLGQEPHEVLVVETKGPPQDFIKATRKIPGLEWLAEYELEEKMPPEHGFEAANDPSKPLPGHIYFVLTNQTALAELHRLFKKWKENPETKFPHGTAAFKTLFAHIGDIRLWNEKDRLREEGVFRDWDERAGYGECRYPFDAELWFKRDPNKRKEAQTDFTRVVEQYHGKVVGHYVLPEISYHGVLGEVPSEAFTGMARSEHPLLQCHSIRFFDAVAKSSIPNQGDIPREEPSSIRRSTLPNLPPVVALMDGVPLQNHDHLKGRLKIIELDDFQSGSEPVKRLHGTAVASLICHGDLNLDGDSIPQMLCAMPILKPRSALGDPDEKIPEDRLIVDRIHEAVLRLCEAEPTVRVVNLSVCDTQKPFAREIGPWARLLDWLSYTQNILFVVSAGNTRVTVPWDSGSKPTLSRHFDATGCAIASLTKNPAARRLLAPAETVNGLTVGAIQADGAKFDYQFMNLIDPFDNMHLPGIYSAHGPGYRKAIKPDIFLPGGRELYSDVGTNFHVSPNQLVGLKFATPGESSGELSKTRRGIGTSYAAALASRNACFLHETLSLLREQNLQATPPDYDTVLIKTLLVHGAGRKHFASHKKIFSEHGGKPLTNKQLGYYWGYGELDISTVQTCTDRRVTVLGFGALKEKEGHSFPFPLPDIISTSELSPRLIVTLAWFTPINPRNQEYRVAKLSFKVFGMGKDNLSRVRADQYSAQRGTVQHEIFDIKRAVDLTQKETANIHVYCREGAGKIETPIRYGLAVTFEINPESEIEIYQKIKERLEVTVGA